MCVCVCVVCVCVQHNTHISQFSWCFIPHKWKITLSTYIYLFGNLTSLDEMILHILFRWPPHLISSFKLIPSHELVKYWKSAYTMSNTMVQKYFRFVEFLWLFEFWFCVHNRMVATMKSKSFHWFVIECFFFSRIFLRTMWKVKMEIILYFTKSEFQFYFDATAASVLTIYFNVFIVLSYFLWFCSMLQIQCIFREEKTFFVVSKWPFFYFLYV